MNNYTLFKKIRDKVTYLNALHNEMVFWQNKGENLFDYVEKLPRVKLYESELNNTYILKPNNPNIFEICAKAVKFPEDRDYNYTVRIIYANGNEKLWNNEGIRLFRKSDNMVLYYDFAGILKTTL